MADHTDKDKAVGTFAPMQADDVRPMSGEVSKQPDSERVVELQAIRRSLAEQSRYLDAFFRHTITPLAFLDREFNFIRVNEAYAKADRRDVDEFPGHNHFEFYPSDARAIFEEVVRTRRPFQAFARPFVYADHPERGVTYWDWTLTPLLDRGGEVEALVFSLEDVTMRGRAEVELEQHRKHLEELVQERTRELESANARLREEIAERTETERKLIYLASFPERNPNPVMEADLDGRIRYANSAALNLFPDLRELGLAHPWLADWAAVTHPFRAGRSETGIRDLTVNERDYQQAFYYFAHEGFIRIYGFDITERKRAEEELAQARLDAEHRAAELQTVLDAVPAAVWIARDPECQMIIGNRFSYEIFGLPFGVNVSKSAPEGERPETFRIFKDSREMVPEEMPMQQAASGTIIRDFEFDFVFDDASVRHMLGNAVPLYDAEGSPRGSVGAFVDISEHMRAETALRESEERYHALSEELREIDRSKSNFLAMLSHELRNPLAAIRNGLSILDRATPGGEQSLRAKGIIDRQFSQLSHLVDDLLDVTRISQNKVRLQRRRIELNELVRRTVEDYRPQFEQNGVRIEADYAPSPLFVQADGARLAQVIGNLCQNAAKFTHEGGSTRVTVSCDSAEQRAVIRVADTGAGIPPEMLPRLFQPFTQADTTLDRSRGGLGLGLALVRGLVELHGGDVSVSSAGVDQGSEFVMHLPLDVSCPEGLRPEPAEISHRSLRILVIEDNVDLAEGLQELLVMDGHEIEVAFSGPEGLHKARAFRPAVLLCDIGLPGMDGYAVARAFRADAMLRNMFLVALTGYAQPEDLRRAEEAGFDAHLAKPVDLAALERTLDRIPGGAAIR